jgi:hypothetical protein
MKWDKVVNNIAGDIMAIVDDLSASGLVKEQCWQIARQVTLRLQYLGIQDAPRKRRPPVRNPGAWAGAIFLTAANKITQTVSQAKWDKGQRQVESLRGQLSQDPQSWLNYKELERTCGFLCHLSMTFQSNNPFPKGLSSHHLGPPSEKKYRRMEDC